MRSFEHFLCPQDNKFLNSGSQDWEFNPGIAIIAPVVRLSTARPLKLTQCKYFKKVSKIMSQSYIETNYPIPLWGLD